MICDLLKKLRAKEAEYDDGQGSEFAEHRHEGCLQNSRNALTPYDFKDSAAREPARPPDDCVYIGITTARTTFVLSKISPTKFPQAARLLSSH